ncbi:MAG: AMP-binding protein [Acidobacteria bacterium]|nr:AMP-binding protein [Acidobacteriota bacterium]
MTADHGYAPDSTPPTGGATGPPDSECEPRAALEALQAERLTALLRTLRGRNAFYDRKFSRAGVDVGRLRFPEDLAALPFTTKADLVADQEASPPWGTALTEPLDRYTRYNQTSSTTGRPLRWIDTPETWQWMLECWKAVYRAAGVTGRDRVFFPFSFGPFLGFWTGFDAATQIGAHAIPAGGMTSGQRLALISALAPTVMCCTPTYALRLLDVAREAGGRAALSDGPVRVIIVAGEPGGSIPATRQRIERGWGARVIDHHGLTEVGPISFECLQAPGCLHVNEREFIAEVVDPDTGEPAADGVRGELVITNLGRTASPVIRYRTRDLVVRTRERCACGRTLARLAGGVVARADDMVNVRGVNVYPAAVESVLRAIGPVVEYRCTVQAAGSLRGISVEVEIEDAVDAAAVAALAASRLREALGLSVPVTPVAAGALPRFEMKARRFVVDRGTPPAGTATPAGNPQSAASVRIGQENT